VTQEVLDVSLLHHEKVDGSGYPFGLKGEAISLAARMGAICDVYDALTSDRPYKQGWTPLRAATEMYGWEGHFDRELLFKFFRSIGVVPPGLLVRMRSNRLGIVLPDGAKEVRSKVRIFHCAVEKSPLTLEDVFLSSSGGADQIVSEENPARWGFADWQALSEKLVAGGVARAKATPIRCELQTVLNSISGPACRRTRRVKIGDQVDIEAIPLSRRGLGSAGIARFRPDG
jgi:hypothetical protein